MAHHYATALQKDPTGMRWAFQPKALSIVWGADDNFWEFIEDTCVKLKQVRWLEVRGSTKENLTKGQSYEIKFQVKIDEYAYGWGSPVLMMAKIGRKGRYKFKKLDFSTLPGEGKTQIPDADDKFIIKVHEDNGDDTVLHFGLYEVWSGSWKSGLKIYEAQVTEIP